MIEKLVSGGQTGVDRGALDAALEIGLPCGGWCPKGRRSEDGVISGQYPLEESPLTNYGDRTRRNVLDSDATLILARGTLTGGSALTRKLAIEARCPCLVVNPQDAERALTEVEVWLTANPDIQVLNLAGPRESTDPGVGELAHAFMLRVLGQFSRCRSR
ncbi:MAG: molybdenum cofactor carrier [Gammaproteobacteria bacterium]|nr:MAG: molybdenum cofactor carrier [Gammaproteobacteria bacterium]